MKNYKHGIGTSRTSSGLPEPKIDQMNGVVVIGTAPINLAKRAAVNEVVAAFKKGDADEAFGSSTDFEEYTLLHSIYVQFEKFGVGPLVLINVLNPENPKHIESVADKEFAVEAKAVRIEDKGILLDKLVVLNGSEQLQEGEDYVASFAPDGTVILSATDSGKMAGLEKVLVTYSKLKPSGVDYTDIIGGVDENGVRTGIELLDEVYPRTEITPSMVIAPGYSKDPRVAAALDAKVQLMYSLLNGVAFTDLDSGDTGANMLQKVEETKEKNTVPSRWTSPVWPLAKVGEYKLWGSSVIAASYQYAAAKKGGIPSSSASNTEALIDGICLEDGTDLSFTQNQIDDYVNAAGVTSFLKIPKWKLWGNNTAAYPKTEDPLDRFTKSVIMLNWMENKFKLEYIGAVDGNLNRKIIKDIVNQFNLFLNSLTPGHLAGGKIVFADDENPDAKILKGRMKFHTYYADYVPAEYIHNEFEYDHSILIDALKGAD